MRIIPKFIKTWLTNLLYTDLASKGINGDTELVFLTSQQRYFLKSIGGADTLNPDTKLKQYFGPLAIGLMVGTAAFGIAKLAGASTRTALLAGGLAGLGAGALKGLGTATQASTLVGEAATSAGMAGGTVPATKLSTITATTNPFLAAQPGALGAGTGIGATTAGGTLGNIAAGAGGLTAGTPASSFMATGLGAGKDTFLATQGNVAGPIALGPEAYGVAPEQVGLVKSVSRPDLTVAPTSITDKVVNFAKENPFTTAGAVLTGAKILGDLTAQQPTYDTASPAPAFTEQEYTDARNRQRAAMQRFSERAPAPTLAADALTPANVYERQEEMFAAREGGLATLKLKEGGINYLPSKSDHDEKDANNYVRAMGYVEDGSGNGDKDEDTMLAQLADGEFVSRADAILGAGIMSGANPDDFKDMRRKGAQFFYKQQDSLKRVYDLVSDGNKAS
jgi:hypothetical protein